MQRGNGPPKSGSSAPTGTVRPPERRVRRARRSGAMDGSGWNRLVLGVCVWCGVWVLVSVFLLVFFWLAAERA